jgi:hypothetical protein
MVVISRLARGEGNGLLDQDEKGENARYRSNSGFMANRSQESRRDGNNSGEIDQIMAEMERSI